MRNGLYGKSKEAHVIWTRLGFEDPNYYRKGSAKTEKAVKFQIETQIKAFDVLESDMTAFMMAQTKNSQILFYIAPGPLNPERAFRTFVFLPNPRISFSINALVLLPGANKALFYTENQLGEISLENYPFE